LHESTLDYILGDFLPISCFSYFPWTDLHQSDERICSDDSELLED
jgi:hypothetical protein